jgi:MFS-type transporter involved in bile tolerance (Atg22 family)
MQAGLYSQKTVTTTQHNPTQHTDVAPINVISVSLTITLLVIVLGAIVAYRKHKARVLQQRIHRLNRLWKLDASKKLT